MEHNSGAGLFDKFMPHGMCYMWRADILLMNVVSDILIGLSYFCIPVIIIYFLRRHAEVPYRGMFYMFCVFIGSCGVTHGVAVWNVWHGLYGVQGIVKTWTALVSVATAAFLLPLAPKLVALRGPVELARANAALEEQIDQRRKSELQTVRLQSELARVGRITTLGKLATGLAHELNQPLLAISASTDTALKVAKTPSDVQLLSECLNDIQTETHRAANIIRSLRQLVSKKAPERTLVDVNAIVGEALLMLRHDMAAAGVNLNVHSSLLPEVPADSVQLTQVVVNLARNAIEALAGDNSLQPDQKEITIKTLEENGNVCITVSDSGPGIQAGVDPFEMFESNKKDGIGMGLPISRDIIQSHGGQLVYEQSVDRGAVFVVRIPVAPGAIAEIAF